MALFAGAITFFMTTCLGCTTEILLGVVIVLTACLIVTGLANEMLAKFNSCPWGDTNLMA